jgi:hypothetical protein
MALDADYALLKKWSNWFDRKYGDGYGPANLLQRRTMNTAVVTVSTLQNIPFAELSSSLYFFCSDIESKAFSRLYESQVELAGANPDKFIKGLHSFFNATAHKIKKESEYALFFDFLMAASRLLFTAKEENQSNINIDVVYCYFSILLQQTEYLRPDKFDLTKVVCGMKTTGELLVMEDTYPFLDKPSFELERRHLDGKIRSPLELNAQIKEIYGKWGYDYIQNTDDLELYTQVDRIFSNQIAGMAALINEYTFDILPQHRFSAIANKFFSIVALPVMMPDEMHELLRTKRSSTLPANGAVFEFASEKDIIRKVLLKETLYGDSIYMLYRLDTCEGDLSGYYDTKTGFFFSVFLDSEDRVIYGNIRRLVLTLYACAVTRKGPELLAHLSDHIKYLSLDDKGIRKFDDVSISYYGCGGRLRNVYDGAEATGKGGYTRKGDEAYEEAPRAIQGFIRKVGEGRTPSREAVEYAEALGYSLAPDETYVRPFIRRVLRLRQKPDREDTITIK